MQSWEKEVLTSYDEKFKPEIIRLNGTLEETKADLDKLSEGGIGLLTYRKLLSRGFENL